jgi:hypothetical protein
VAPARECYHRPFGAVSELITDANADSEAVKALIDCGVQVTLVGDGQR